MLSGSPPVGTGFRELFRASHHRQSVCVLAILAWIAACDGKVDESEGELLRKVAEAGEDAAELAAVLEAARSLDADDLEMACGFLRTQTSRGDKRLLAQLAIAMAIQDGRLTVSENWVLQFLADLLAISPRGLGRLFQQIARRPFPIAGDPSDPAWWERRETGLEAQAPTDGIASDSIEPLAPPPAMSRQEAMAVLGLEVDASATAVHAAYRRLAKKRHPDRFAPLGPAAVASATFMFERLQQAQQLLLTG